MIFWPPTFYFEDHYYRLYIYYLITFKGKDANDEKEEPSEISLSDVDYESWSIHS